MNELARALPKESKASLGMELTCSQNKSAVHEEHILRARGTPPCFCLVPRLQKACFFSKGGADFTCLPPTGGVHAAYSTFARDFPASGAGRRSALRVPHGLFTPCSFRTARHAFRERHGTAPRPSRLCAMAGKTVHSPPERKTALRGFRHTAGMGSLGQRAEHHPSSECG